MSIHCFPAQMLQGGHAVGERSDELQGDLLPAGVNVVDIPTVIVLFTLTHVEINQLENAVKVGNGLNVFRVSLQVKRVHVTFNTEVLGARYRLDTEGEQVLVVGAVTDQKGAHLLIRQHGIGIPAGDGAPVEAALLELLKCGQDHVILVSAGERFVMVRQPHVGAREAAAHHGVKLAVSYHGAVPAFLAAWGSTGSVQTGEVQVRFRGLCE